MEIIIIDDNVESDSPFVVELGIVYGDNNIKIFTNSNDGLNYVQENLFQRMIVILDINFPPNEKNGHQVLKEIREHNKLIPVIIWSAFDGTNQDFTDFINNHALYYVKQTDSYREIIRRVKDAEHHLNLDVATAIENWLEEQENKDQTLSIDSTGKAYSANDLITEIRLQTEEGRKIEENIIQLTIDLLFRKKEII